ncbi:MAG: pentapeptide repeat-containing protein [Acidobacteria bacterium]|nr:pentapeptide repeat-containing protein [Acidobacteriota bacterium]MBI3425378.1 pentapeptide repeat-containing protein [Acidobacteriota bacterium]
MGASFSAEAYFSRASFSAEANFEGASFSAKARFSGANFSADAYFMGASFSAEADFYGASFKDYAHFAGSKERKALGEKAYLDLQFAKFEKPERVSFHTLILRPNWFINVDSRKFEFVDVEWNFRLKEELKSASEAKVSAPHRLLAITYRQLADNAEANHRYHEASRFRYNAFEARRIEKFHGFVPWRLDWWYWLASGYGESVGRAFLVFVALLALLTLGYKRSEFVPTAPTAAPPATVVANTAPPTAPDLPPKRLGWREAALYSFNVSILQKPEPKPKGLWSSFLVSLETVLGPAQAALLALAVRRRFMR